MKTGLPMTVHGLFTVYVYNPEMNIDWLSSWQVDIFSKKKKHLRKDGWSSSFLYWSFEIFSRHIFGSIWTSTMQCIFCLVLLFSFKFYANSFFLTLNKISVAQKRAGEAAALFEERCTLQWDEIWLADIKLHHETSVVIYLHLRKDRQQDCTKVFV